MYIFTFRRSFRRYRAEFVDYLVSLPLLSLAVGFFSLLMSSGKKTVAGEWIPGPLGMGTELVGWSLVTFLWYAAAQVHASVSPDNETGAILTPVFLSTTFVQESVDKYLAKVVQQLPA